MGHNGVVHSLDHAIVTGDDAVRLSRFVPVLRGLQAAEPRLPRLALKIGGSHRRGWHENCTQRDVIALDAGLRWLFIAAVTVACGSSAADTSIFTKTGE